MGQAAKDKPYSKELSDHYMNQMKKKNERVRHRALKALKKEPKLNVKK
ncbi:hypothetical protein P4631_00750 [Halalkalibacterium halodurans]|uniref:BH1760 protein n=1 Tax=Halalkalibacterium halodurans (strain ATCC BAA-125 / DSM 18197 / FERM 7344 / JCM 9153 / C-125) TaxID=272558 RepID=Q9KC14_HALH5|nr:hypothetical protein [Halalkalibacterium halodurans]MED4124652.1 hypothetical protein [Halalkalibacterium halodurans]MED4170976.1 hypothetical protein [Halalkalibacterium halodurans]BAB05479.1 BH1760 [Halalkalibacterium halodurans C-125]